MRLVRFVLAFLLLAAFVEHGPTLAMAASPLAVRAVVAVGTPIVSPTLAATQATPTVALSPTPADDTTNGTFIAGIIIWVVIIVLVAVTAFLVWRTRPRR